MKLISPYLRDNMAVAVDLGDLVKPEGKCFEMISYVRDGDKGSIKPGYDLLKIVARCPSSIKSFPLISRLFSVDEEGYLSENDEIIKSIDAVSKQSGKDLLYVMDRGADRSNIILPLINNKRRFLIRLADKRHLIWRNEREKEPMVLLTSDQVRGKRQILRVIRQYLDRWAVEESYRFEKTV